MFCIKTIVKIKAEGYTVFNKEKQTKINANGRK